MNPFQWRGMKTKLAAFWESLKTSFWFLPSLMVVAAIGLSYGIIYIDRHWIAKEWLLYGLLYTGGLDGAREILSTIAGSAITVAGVIFSITMVALTLTTNQFGPRLLRNFTRDRGNQIVLGIFIGTFIYCLLVSRTIQVEGNETYFPRFAVSFSILLAVIDVGVLVYFINHVASSIQADQVVDNVSNELHSAIYRLFPHEREGTSVAAPRRPAPPALKHLPGQVVAGIEGYLVAIDADHLLHLAQKHDLVMQTHHRLGDFVFPTVPIVSYSPTRDLDADFDKSVRRSFVVESQRTSRQDVEFAVSKLVEVAVRALSPSINDPFTAMSCINRLGAALSLISRREFPVTQWYDSGGNIRLHLQVITFDDLLEAAFDQIRLYSSGNYDVQMRLLQTLRMLAATAGQQDHLEIIRRHAGLIRAGVKHDHADEEVFTRVDYQYRSVLEQVAARKDGHH